MTRRPTLSTPQQRRICSARRLCVEALEERRLLSATPLGATWEDTGEFMLGRVVVTPVFMESNGLLDTSTEDWSAAQIDAMKATIEEGLQWWVDTLAAYNTVHSLEFVMDYQYADNPVETIYEPISRRSNDYTLWVNEFLDAVGGNSPQGISDDIRAFNHSQREAHDADWAFTIFVVDADADPDNRFDPSGSFSRAFALSGGRLFVTPSSRPASTIAHETGHMFWARDEYAGGGSYTQQRGYYNAANLNASDNPAPGFVQEDSLMASGIRLSNSYQNHTLPESTRALIGWRDTDGDGVFDVLDVPHSLDGSGYYDVNSGKYLFTGTAEVGILPNQNSSGPQNDISINRLSAVQYRLDGGAWQTAASLDGYQADLALAIDVESSIQTIEIRTVTWDPVTTALVTESETFTASLAAPAHSSAAGISGFVFDDLDRDGQWDADETPHANAEIVLVDAATGLPIRAGEVVEPDDFDDDAVLNTATPGVALTAIGVVVHNEHVVSRVADEASTGSRVFGHFLTASSVSTEWTSLRQLRADFDEPTSRVRIDVIGNSDDDYGRLEAFDSQGNLLARDTTAVLSDGQTATLVVELAVPEIAYVIVSGHQSAGVRLDNLQFGPQVRTHTDALGGYQLTGLGSGEFMVSVSATGTRPVAPATGQQLVVLAAAESEVNGVDFALENVTGPSDWQNPDNPFDVNNDGRLSTRDVFVLADVILTVGTVRLPHPGVLPPGNYPDVNGNWQIEPRDLLAIGRALTAPESEALGTSADRGSERLAATSVPAPAPIAAPLGEASADDLPDSGAGEGPQDLETLGEAWWGALPAAPEQYGPAQYGPAQYGPAQHGPAQHGPAQHGPAHSLTRDAAAWLKTALPAAADRLRDWRGLPAPLNIRAVVRQATTEALDPLTVDALFELPALWSDLPEGLQTGQATRQAKGSI